MLEWEVPDRDIQVFSSTYDKDRLREKLIQADMEYAKEETEYEDSLRNKGVLKMLAENDKNRKFQSKRFLELEKIWKKKVYSWTVIWI